MGEKDRNKREEMMEEIVEEKVLSLTVIGIGELGGKREENSVVSRPSLLFQYSAPTSLLRYIAVYNKREGKKKGERKDKAPGPDTFTHVGPLHLEGTLLLPEPTTTLH